MCGIDYVDCVTVRVLCWFLGRFPYYMNAFVRDVEACEWNIFVECIRGNYHPVISNLLG